MSNDYQGTKILTNRNQTPLAIASEVGNIEIVKCLIDCGAVVNEKSGKLWITPLYIACLRGDREIIERLVQKGANIGATNKWKKTAIDAAEEYWHMEIVHFLRETASRREQEEKDWQFALQLQRKLDEEDEELSRLLALQLQQEREAERKVASDDDSRQCIICFEKPTDPVGCVRCQQLIGCRHCVERWRGISQTSDYGRASPLSIGISSINHRCCPLCRYEWDNVPEVFDWDAQDS
ncbi:unnamed protein product [Enterobius vermicularis]|uniref:RING-type domain-containing protein n=1 Tax=Enterobius vermicularis TaxID=51028 RepID=A0A0N4VB71_ENTVE|nr:unnamed protein product [Enterobius vermicularis]